VSASQQLHLRVAVDRDASPISGQVTAGKSPTRSFAGWTELFAALQAAIADHPDKEAQDAEGS
jgi:hypothetical protein